MRVAGWKVHAALAVMACLIASLPWLAPGYYVGFASTALVAALFALSLQILVGGGNMVSLGHAGFFGVGAYMAWYLTPEGIPTSILITWSASMLAGALAALMVGALALRTQGFYFLMTTLAFGQMLYFILHDTALGGGADGVYITRPALGAFGYFWEVSRQDRAAVLLWINLAALIAVYIGLALLMQTLFGRALLGIKANEPRMSALGAPTYRYRLAAFVLAGALAGLAGHQWAMTQAFISPELLGWHRSAIALLAIVLGGVGVLHGPIIGAIALAALSEAAGLITERENLVVGLVILAVVLALPSGLAGLRARSS